MSKQTFSLKGVIQKGKEYLENCKDLSRLMILERGSKIISGLILTVSMLIFGLIGILFLSIALALFLSEATGSMALGFLAIAGIYLLIILIIALLKKRIKDKLINLTIKKVFKKWNESDEI